MCSPQRRHLDAAGLSQGVEYRANDASHQRGLAATALGGRGRRDGSGTGVNPGDNNSAADSGAVYVFTRSGATWTQQLCEAVEYRGQ